MKGLSLVVLGIFMPAGQAPVLAHVVELGMLLLLLAVAAGVGLRVLGFLRVDRDLGHAERLVFGVMLGYGAISFLMLAVGLLGLLYLPVVNAMLLGLAILGAGPLLLTLRGAARGVRPALKGLLYLPNLFLALVILIVVFAALVKALVPAATQDDLMYHLALPSRYVADHRVNFYPDSTYSLFPQMMEMLYTLALMQAGDRLAVLIAFSTGLLAAAAAALFTRRLLAEREGGMRALPLLVAAIFLTTPLTGFIMRAANTDLAQAAAEMLAFYAFYLAFRAGPLPNPRLLALSGICGGLAFSVKYYGGLVPGLLGVALALTLAYRLYKGASPRKALAALLAYALPGITLAGVWLLRNFISSGNPVWPAAGHIFGGLYWSPAADPQALLGNTPGLSLESLGTVLKFRFDAIGRAPFLLDNHLYTVNLGPLLMTALLLLVAAKWKPPLRALFALASLLWLVSIPLFSRTSIRYLSTFFLFSAVLGGYAAASVAGRIPVRPLRLALGAALSLALTVLSLEILLSAGPYLPTAFALDPAQEGCYLQAHMEDYPVVQYIADSTPPDAVIYIWDSIPRGYRVPRPYVYGRLVPAYSGVGADTAAWHARLQQLGITHVLIHNRAVLAPTYPPGYDPDRPLVQALAADYFGPPLIEAGDYTLYKLR